MFTKEDKTVSENQIKHRVDINILAINWDFRKNTNEPIWRKGHIFNTNKPKWIFPMICPSERY
jgi:hypothetical protein